MYGFAAKRFDRDIYRNKRWLRNADFALGFFTALLIWILFFRLVWWAAPAAIFIICMAGLFAKVERRYVLYGGLALVFFPFIFWAAMMVFWAGRNEINS